MKWRRFIPHTFLFFAGLGSAVWSFVRLPFPLLGENPLLDLVDYHTPNFYGRVMLWYYASPFVAVMLAGLILLSVWKVWLEGRGRDFAPFGGLPTWPLSPRQKAPANCDRGGRGAEDFQSLLAHHPGAGPVYRSGHLRGRRVRQDFGVHAPLRPPASRLASGESTEAGGRPFCRLQPLQPAGDPSAHGTISSSTAPLHSPSGVNSGRPNSLSPVENSDLRISSDSAVG